MCGFNLTPSFPPDCQTAETRSWSCFCDETLWRIFQSLCFGHLGTSLLWHWFHNVSGQKPDKCLKAALPSLESFLTAPKISRSWGHENKLCLLTPHGRFWDLERKAPKPVGWRGKNSGIWRCDAFESRRQGLIPPNWEESQNDQEKPLKWKKHPGQAFVNSRSNFRTQDPYHPTGEAAWNKELERLTFFNVIFGLLCTCKFISRRKVLPSSGLATYHIYCKSHWSPEDFPRQLPVVSWPLFHKLALVPVVACALRLQRVAFLRSCSGQVALNFLLTVEMVQCCFMLDALTVWLPPKKLAGNMGIRKWTLWPQ